MSKSLIEIAAAADWKEMTPRLLHYAESLIRQCPWRSLAISVGPAFKVSVEGFGADDFLHEALERFLSGRRSYNHSVSFELNLKGAIRSIIWSVNKSSRRTPLIVNPDAKDEGDFPDQQIAADEATAAAESVEQQKRMLQSFEDSLAGEDELLRLLSAYKAGHSKPRDVEKFTNIPATRVSELKRKLRSRMEEFEARAPRRQND